MGRITARGVLAGALALAVAVVCIRLGFWQLERLDQRRARNAAVEAALALPPVELRGPVLDSISADPGRFWFRRARASGSFDPAGEVVLRGRALRGSPGVHLVTPLRLGGEGPAVLVDRGWVPAADAATVDPRRYAVAGGAEVTGVLQPISAAGEPGTGVPVGGVVSYARLDLSTLRSRLPYPLLPVQLQLAAGGDGEAAGRPVAVPPPDLSEGPHLGYAVQWFSFAAIAVIGFLVVALKPRRAG